VHSNLKNVIFSGADTKHQKYQSNVKTGYCRICKCCMGGPDMRVIGARESMMVDYMLYVQMRRTKMPVDNCFEKFEEDLYRGKVDIPDTMPHPRSDGEKYELFQTTPAFQTFKEQYPHYHASIPVAHFTLETLLMISLCMESYISQSSLQM